MTTTPIRIAIVGVGKIVRDQHLPALAANKDFELVATASRNGTVDGVPAYRSIEAMLTAEKDIDAVSLCMPPQARYEAAHTAIAAGKHVFLEKPPGATISEVEDLRASADVKRVTLFASWHSRYAPAVEAAKAFLAGTRIRSVRIIWKEDVRRWHPNQDWIWQPGGLGVFDPGINALSIVTHILPPLHITSAVLDFPSNRDAPIAVKADFAGAGGLAATMDLDWLQTGPQTWNIEADTDAGTMVLSSGGAKLSIGGKEAQDAPEREYPALYECFAALVKAGQSDVDIAPLRHVADAFMLGKRNIVEEFHD